MDNTVTGGGRRRAVTKTSAEDQALDQIAKEAEARLAARRQARAEAREIRMRELERLQKEIEENADRVYDMYTDPVSRTTRVAAAAVASPRLNASASLVNNSSFQSSRRSSEDSLEETGSIRDVRHELKEVEEKFRKAMIQNAQLDNEKASLNYQVELFKDRLEDLEEAHSQLQREHKEKCRAHEQAKRASARHREEATCYQLQLEERDEMIAQHGLQIVGGEEGDARRVLVTLEHAQLLQDVGEGSLDVRLRRLREERDDLTDEVRRLQLALEEGRSRSEQSRSVGAAAPTGPGLLVNGGSDTEEAQRETNKMLADYKFKLQKAEQDVSTLQANVARLESQVVRYKGASESSEKVEDELKVERRKLQREGSNEEDDASAGNNVCSADNLDSLVEKSSDYDSLSKQGSSNDLVAKQISEVDLAEGESSVDDSTGNQGFWDDILATEGSDKDLVAREGTDDQEEEEDKVDKNGSDKDLNDKEGSDKDLNDKEGSDKDLNDKEGSDKDLNDKVGSDKDLNDKEGSAKESTSEEIPDNESSEGSESDEEEAGSSEPSA